MQAGAAGLVMPHVRSAFRIIGDHQGIGLANIAPRDKPNMFPWPAPTTNLPICGTLISPRAGRLADPGGSTSTDNHEGCSLSSRRIQLLVATLCTVFVMSIGIGGAQAADTPKPPQIRWEIQRLVNNLNEGCQVVDVNNDGKLDIIAGPCWYEGPMWRQHLLREIDEVSNEFYHSSGDHAIDLNGDGYVDLITSSWFRDRIEWYENPGKEGLLNGQRWQGHLIMTGKPACEGLLLQDVDGDGIPEVMYNSWTDDNPFTLIRITPGKDGKPPEFLPINLAEKGNGHGIAVGDINGDRRNDIIVRTGWYEAPAGDIWTARWKFHAGFAQQLGLGKLSVPGIVVDLSGDGKNDVIMGHGHDYGLWWLEQGPTQDDNVTWIKHEIDMSFSQAHCLAWGDLDGDGKPELVTGKRFRPHGDKDPGAADPQCLFRYIWDASRKTFERDTISYNASVGTGMQINIVDIDGDKRNDLIVPGKSGLYVLLNRGPADQAQAAK